jgi:hypothetical protein
MFWSTSQSKLSRHKSPDLNKVNYKAILETPVNSHKVNLKQIQLRE